MGVVTNVKLVGNISVESIVEYLENTLGLTINANITNRKNYMEGYEDVIFLNEEGVVSEIEGFLNFNYKGDKRNLFYSHKDIVWFNKEEMTTNIINNVQELNGETTWLSLGYDENAVELLTKVASHFNGYIDENDCDDKYYHKCV